MTEDRAVNEGNVVGERAGNGAVTDRGVVNGLEGVVVANTSLSRVDAAGGELVLCGHRLDEVAGVRSFEHLTAAMLNAGVGEDQWTAKQVAAALGEGRVRASEQVQAMTGSRGAGQGPMDRLRALVASASLNEDNAAGALDLIAFVGVASALIARESSGADHQDGGSVEPDAGVGHAHDLLRLSLQVPPTSAAASALETYLVTVCDHGMNASTFTARVVASTGSDLVSAVTAAIGALKGPLHGGAPGPVLDMLDAVGDGPDPKGRATRFLEGELDAKRRIMGMGHRVYRARDPRAYTLAKALKVYRSAAGDEVIGGRLALAQAVEEAAETLLSTRYPDRALKANVEFYTAVLLDALGFDRSVFSPVFACGRVLGWCAHVFEQRRTGRLIRPASAYIGTIPEGMSP